MDVPGPGPDEQHEAGDAVESRSDGALHRRLRRLEETIGDGERLVAREVSAHVTPAWRRVTQGEPRWPVSLAIVLTVGLQLSVPDRLTVRPRLIVPVLEALLLVGIIVVNPRRVNRRSPRLRAATMALIGLISVANGYSAGRLIVGLVQGTEKMEAPRLLLVGGAIWLTNVIAFSLWYWELDRGGPAARATGPRPYPDFFFPQMDLPDLAPPDWTAGYADYLFMSFTNATAFSPTDVLPLTPWAKLMMMAQSAVSLMTAALVIARAVNILQ